MNRVEFPSQAPAPDRPEGGDLNPVAFPLWGSRLIEASAGTGKTFTLALLYTRLVLGHGIEGSAFDRPLMPPEILVVTFTEAATQELRDRIRQRLVEAAGYFEADPRAVAVAGDPGRDPLDELRATIPAERWPWCARQLRMAADWMDEAVISTIHGWCNRMLREHAFDTRGLFERELTADPSDLVAEVIRDYWRVHFYPLPPERAAAVLDVVQSPEGLEQRLGDWLGQRGLGLSYKGAPIQCDALDEPLRRHAEWLAERERVECERAASEDETTRLEDAARALWRAGRATLEAHLQELRPHLDGTRHDSANPDKFAALLASIAAWSEGGEAPGKLKSFAQGAFGFKKSAKVQREMAHPAFQAIAAWQAALGARPAPPEAPEPPLAACLLAHAARWVDAEIERRRLQRAEMDFDDLLRQLDAALDPAQGEAAARLAATIRRQFPVALIDEFQDTDPIQYRLFDRIYEVGAARKDSALVMIGDPKQAIYGFRGADIHAYLEARAATRGRHYTLGRNFRSTQGLVDACNRLFEQAEGHARGAFRFKTEADNPIPFHTVAPEGRPERLILDGGESSAVTVWTLEAGDGPVAMTEYRERMAESAATQVARWLEQAQAGRAGFHDEGGLLPLRPRDIAILVRNRAEATLIRESLAARRVASVFLSDRDSVFETQEAADLLHWLRACATPTDEGLVRAALGTNTLAIPLRDLAALFDDELAWELQMERFRDYRVIWRRRGVLAMLRRLMRDTGLPTRLVGRGDGERILTNLLHLAEWLQRSAAGIDGEQALIRHLAEHLGETGDEYVLRLESDAELVQVITIHKSKGLEYPLVLLPFICGWREVNGRVRQVAYRAERGRCLEIAGKQGFAAAWEAADDERLGEDMRLLYVALTRARHGLWLGIAPLKQGNAKKIQLERSAIGHLLTGGRPFATAAELWERLRELERHIPGLVVEPAPDPAPIQLSPALAVSLDPARPAPRLRLSPWWITSYSALRQGARVVETAEESPEAPPAALDSAETASQETALEETADAATQEPVQAPARPIRDRRLHAFPRGSRYGTFLHGILEWAALLRAPDREGRMRRGFAATAEARAPRREMLGRRCHPRRLTEWIVPLDEWLVGLLTRVWRLDGLPDADGRIPSLRLVDLEPSRYQVELEFWLEGRDLDLQRLDRLTRQYTLEGRPRPALGGQAMNGLLKGFIDLVFEHGGRYYLLDWKSNWLGPDDAAYGQEAMRAVIAEARYDLQYVLYLLALHRQLKARLPDYDYDRHLGGAIYVFLRGAEAESQGLFMDRPPRVLIESLDRLFAGEEVAA